MAAAVKKGFITQQTRVLDIGCGWGKDVEVLNGLGIAARGYDPFLSKRYEEYPEYLGDRLEDLQPADVVTCLYVLNVIPTPRQREEVLKHCYELARKYIILATPEWGGHDFKGKPWGDGWHTRWKTFEKPYDFAEFKSLLRTTYGTEPIPVDRICYAIDKSKARPLWFFDLSEDEKSLLRCQLEMRSCELQSEWVAPEGVTYSIDSKGNYRLCVRSKNKPKLIPHPDTGEMKSFVHLGKPGTWKYQWGMGGLKRREEVRIVEERLGRLG